MKKLECFNNLSHHGKVKLLEAVCFATAIGFVLSCFSLPLLIAGLFAGWIFQGVGLCVTLHRLCTHNSFVPKNRTIKMVLLTIGTLGTVGSPIAWTHTHRLHHKYADHAGDPTNPQGSTWHKIKNFFSHFEPLPTGSVCIKDLLVDSDYRFFHKYYFRIILAYVLVLFAISPILVVYFYAVPVVYNVVCIGWVSTLAHLRELSVFGYRNYDTNDNTYNSLVWQVLTMGEGLHNNHHANAGRWNTAVKWWEFDIAAQIIKLIGIPKGDSK